MTMLTRDEATHGHSNSRTFKQIQTHTRARTHAHAQAHAHMHIFDLVCHTDTHTGAPTNRRNNDNG